MSAIIRATGSNESGSNDSGSNESGSNKSDGNEVTDSTLKGRDTGVGFSTLSVHAGKARQKSADSITDPICCTSTYTFANTQSIIDFIEQKQPREEYGRYGNPNEKVVEAKLAALDHAEEAIVYSSGMAAIV